MSAKIITHKLCKTCGATKPATKEHWHWSPENLANCVSRCKPCASAARAPNKLSTSEKFWRRVDKSAGPLGCWPWTGARHYRGYGKFGRHRALHDVYAHRYAYADRHGPIAAGLEVRHQCDNPPCCNPAHLSLGTHQDNMEDMVQRKRLPDRRGERGYTTRLTESQVVSIRARSAEGATAKALSTEFGVSPVTIGAIVRRRIWKHVA